MRKTPGHNPRGLDKFTWNYRCLQLRHALGWSQEKLARVAGISRNCIYQLEGGYVNRPTFATINSIKTIEKMYADILKEYKKAPVRMDRLRKPERGRVRLLPIEIRRPQDIESLGEVEGDSQPMFFGRKTRRRMQQTGLSVREITRRRRISEGVARTIARKAAESRGELSDSKEVQLGQSDDK